MWEEISMTLNETITLIKNYDEQTKNYYTYMEKINHALMSNINYRTQIKSQMVFDDRLKVRLITLGNTSNGILIQKYFPDIFEEENKKIR